MASNEDDSGATLKCMWLRYTLVYVCFVFLFQCMLVLIRHQLLNVLTGVNLMHEEEKAWSAHRHRRDHSL